VIGYLYVGTPEANAASVVAFRKGLGEGGFVEGATWSKPPTAAQKRATRAPTPQQTHQPTPPRPLNSTTNHLIFFANPLPRPSCFPLFTHAQKSQTPPTDCELVRELPAGRAEVQLMKNLVDRRFMKIQSAGCVPLSKQYFRPSVITDADRAALAAIK
jgi:predicted 2-oxoglutarate/Fe(II)-dependent dioxygenase YbiX